VTRRLLVLLCIAWLQAANASADWLFTPFIGYKFGGTSRPTNDFVDLENAEGLRKVTLGGSVALLSDGIFGVEADFSFIPGYFQGDIDPARVSSSAVTTFTGNVIVAVPLGVTQYSLRPYIVGGLGLIRASSDTIPRLETVFDVRENLFGLNVGGGAIGSLTNRTSLRFELRHFINLGGEENAVGFGRQRLSFWRATVGVAFRY
jgi:Outer membrane protein beta-barrel domain